MYKAYKNIKFFCDTKTL